MPNEHVALHTMPDSFTQNPGTKTTRHPDWMVNPQNHGGGLCGRHTFCDSPGGHTDSKGSHTML